jgi:opacity protein-like surface antigen
LVRAAVEVVADVAAVAATVVFLLAAVVVVDAGVAAAVEEVPDVVEAAVVLVTTFIAMPRPRTLARPTLNDAASARLRAAGWGLRVFAMTARYGWKVRRASDGGESPL